LAPLFLKGALVQLFLKGALAPLSLIFKRNVFGAPFFEKGA
jgi:hypothetical protein